MLEVYIFHLFNETYILQNILKTIPLMVFPINLYSMLWNFFHHLTISTEIKKKHFFYTFIYKDVNFVWKVF